MSLPLWLLVLSLASAGVTGLRITRLSVPRVVDVRGSATLGCAFDLDTSRLYSVKWYKDDQEFCRFMPDGSPRVQTFRVAGVHLSGQQCNVTTVVLGPLEYSASGLYACEVSAEAPHFNTAQTGANMTVLGLPRRSPAVTGIRDVYAVGDFVEGNCTSDPSHPPAVLDWYVNDNRVEAWQLENYAPAPGDALGLSSSTLGISFQVDHSHFSGRGNTMGVRCVARVGDTSREVSRTSRLADLDAGKSAQGLYGNGGGRGPGPPGGSLPAGLLAWGLLWGAGAGRRP